MNDIIAEAQAEAIRRDERERIAGLLADGAKCPPGKEIHVRCMKLDCFICWRDYMEPKP